MYPPPEQWEQGRKLLRRQWLSGAGARGTCPGRMVVWEDASIMHRRIQDFVGGARPPFPLPWIRA